MKRNARMLLRALALMLVMAVCLSGAAGAYAEAVQITRREATPSEPERDAVSQLSLSVSQSGGRITAAITNASSREVEITFSLNGSRVELLSVIGNGSVTTGVLGAGVYTVRAEYVTPAEGITAVTKNVEIPAEQQVTPTPTVEAVTPTPTAPLVELITPRPTPTPTVETLTPTPTVEAVTPTPTAPLIEEITPRPTPTVEAVTPTPTAPLVELITPRPTPTPTPEAAQQGITISLVIGGERQLVVCGSAKPNTDVTITTTPQSTAYVVRSDAGGSYAAAISCNPGTYTEVSVQYAGDAASRVSLAGSFVVKDTAAVVTPTPEPTPTPTPAPAKPPIRVDPVTHKAIYVYAYSAPGTVVNLGVQGYGQTLTADKNGCLVYSLPQTYPKGTVMTFTVYYDSTKTTCYTFKITVGADSHYRTLTRGAYGEDVLMLTERLQQLGYPITPTMTCTSDVMYAVRLFQKRNGLTVDGLAGPKTQNKLYSTSAVRMEDGAQSGAYGTLRRSTRYNAAVVPMQRRLRELGYPVGKVDGYFGSQTYRAVTYFQRVNGISPADGVADPATLQLLYSAVAKRYNGTPAGGTGSSITYRLLYWGSEGEHVRRLQSALLAAGYSQVRVADGIFGKWTYDGVVAFQKDHNLLVDGIAGKQTQNALYGTSF